MLLQRHASNDGGESGAAVACDGACGSALQDTSDHREEGLGLRREGNTSRGRILDESSIRDLPWGVVMLLGGGFALAEASKVSGLAACMAKSLIGLQGLSPVSLLFVIVLLTSLITEVNSNVAATAMLLPVVSQIALGLRVSPLAHMMSVTLACSFAFMLPISTPPNAIAFATKAITSSDMLSTGVWLNLAACLLCTLYTVTFFKSIYGHDPFELPDWATNQPSELP